MDPLIFVKVVPSLFKSLVVIYDEKKRKVCTARMKSTFHKKPIRISFSYLYRVKFGDRYLLVYNSKRNHFQPPGGVYKGKGKSKLFDDNLCENDYVTNAPIDDFRAVLKSSKNLQIIYDEFLKSQFRETGFFREFNEELIETGILSKELFSNVRELAHCITGKRFVETGNDVINFYHFDIIDWEITQEQKTFFEKMPNYKESEYVWVSRDKLLKSEVKINVVANPRSVQEHTVAHLAPHVRFLVE